MSTHWLTQKRLAIGIALLLVILSFLPAGVVTALARPPHWLLSTAVGAPIGFAGWSGEKIGLEWSDVGLDPVTDASGSQLRTRLLEALQYSRDLEEKLRRLQERYQRLTRTKARLGAEVRLVEARVVGLSDSSVKPVLSIDRGRRAGLRQGQAVVYAGNLVGQVEMAGPVTADVRLITAAETGLSVRIVPPSSQAPSRELVIWAELNDNRDAFIAEPSQGRTVTPRDLAHLDDDRWPAAAQGYIVGRVTDVGPKESRPLELQQVRIEPLVPLKQLGRVTVLVPGPRPTEGGEARP
jgi:hypothetical protein